VSTPANTFFQHKITNLFTVGPRPLRLGPLHGLCGTGGYVGRSQDRGLLVVTGLATKPDLTVRRATTAGKRAAASTTWSSGGPLVDVLLGLEYQHYDVGRKMRSASNPSCNPDRMGRRPERQGRPRPGTPDHQDVGIPFLLLMVQIS
jgi:hypothetical protein